MVKVIFQEFKKCLVIGSLALTTLSSSVTHASMGEEEHDLKSLIFQQSTIVEQICKHLTFEDFKETTLDDQSFLSFPNKTWREAFFREKQVQVNLNSKERAHEFFKQGGEVDPSINASVRLFTLIKQKIVVLTSTLTCLNLSGSEIEDDGVEALAAGNRPNLRILDLSKTKIGDDGVTAFAAGNWAELWNLNLSNTKIGDDGVTAFAGGNWPNLRKLRLFNTRVGDDGIEAFAAGNWPQLFDLDISNTKIGNEGIQALAAGNWPKLWRLYLPNTKMTVSSLGLLKKEKFPRLRELFLSGSLTEDHKSVETVLRKSCPGLRLNWRK